MKLSVNRATKWALLSASAAVALTTSPLAIAQDENEVEEIVVTGSRIRQNPLDARAPVMTLSNADIERSGLTSIGDLLQKMPNSGAALNSKFNSSGNFGFPPDGGGIGAGSSQIDIRGLSAKRTLVLVDGRRWVLESSASGVSSSADLSTIPVSVIERIEILEDGASPIYGSDAIGGVVNIITKSDFEGIEASAYYGLTDSNDGATQAYTVSLGATGDRARVFADVSYMDANPIFARDRDISSFPVPNFGRCLGNCSSGTPQGRFVFGDPNTGNFVNATINDGVTGIPVYDPTNPNGGGDFHGFTTADRFNYSQYNLIQTPVSRLGIFSKAEYDITDEIMFELKALYSTRTSTNQAAPEPLFLGTGAGSGAVMDSISIDVTNPYNPFGFTIDNQSQIDYAALTGGQPGTFFMGRRPIEAGPRIFDQTVDTFYVSGALEGSWEMGGNDVYWDVAAAWGRSHGSQLKRGAFNASKLKTALGPLAVCNATPGCVPFNFFGGQGAGGGTITQAMLDYVGFVQKDESEQSMFDLTANLTGTIGELPAGPLGFAMGVEHRVQKGYFQPDAVVLAGDSAGVPSSATKGEYNVDEIYAELNIPIVEGVTGVESFDISVAGRYSDYSTFGTEGTWKAGALWRATDELSFRGSFAKGLRAPGIGELFGAAARFDQTMSDPCSDMLGNFGGTPASAAVQANCIALGVPAAGTYQQFNQQISVTTGGNLALKPEESESIVLGAVFSPDINGAGGWASVTFEANYYSIDVDKAIQALNASTQLNACVNTLDPVLCAGIGRNAGGGISTFSNQLTNIGGVEVRGFDFSVAASTTESNMGSFDFNIDANFLTRYTEITPTATGFARNNLEGTEIGDPERAYPKLKATMQIDWNYKEFVVGYTTRYIGKVTEGCPGIVTGFGVCSNEAGGTNDMSATIYSDLQVAYTPDNFNNRFTLSVGVNNIMNVSPPFCYTCALNGFDGTQYEVPGRFLYARLGFRM